MSEAIEESIDLRGLKCPLPALISRRRLSRSAPGTVIVVVTDDPMAPIDVPHMCADEGFDVISVETQWLRGADDIAPIDTSAGGFQPRGCSAAAVGAGGANWRSRN